MVAEVYGGISAFKAAFDIAKGLKDIDDATRRNAAVIELQEQILGAQAAQTALIEDIGKLKKQVAEFEAWDLEKKRYILKEVYPGGFAYVLKEGERGGEEPHMLCVYCYERRKKHLLQRAANDAGRAVLRCFACNAEVRIHSETAPPVAKRVIRPDRVCPYCDGEMKLTNETNHPQLGRVGMKFSTSNVKKQAVERKRLGTFLPGPPASAFLPWLKAY